MTNKLWKKVLVLGIVVSFLGAGVIPSISGDIGKISIAKDGGKERIDYESITVTLTASSYKISKGNNGLSKIRIEGFVSDGDPGNPRLPYKHSWY